MMYAHFILDKQDRKGQLKMECESKSYSILEIKLYSPPDDIVHAIPDHLNEDWNYLVYHTKCIHSWIALMDKICRQRFPIHTEYK